MKYGKILKLTTLSLLLMPTMLVKADIQTDTINEVWGKPTVVYGGGLSDNEVQATNKSLGINNIDNVYKLKTEGSDFSTFLSISNVDTNSLFSSVLVQKETGSNKGVTVKIKTPDKITTVTSTQYANAAITAGAKDVEIEVASIKKVSGESALVGVYKALSENGVSVSSDRAQLATEELNVVNTITQENKDSNMSSEKLDNTIATIKSELAKAKEKADNGELSDDIVRTIVKTAIKTNGLDKFISDDQVDLLVNYAKSLQTLPSTDLNDIAQQADILKDKIIDGLTKQYNNLKGSDKFWKFFNNVKNAISDMFNSILNAFNNKSN